MGVKVYTAQAAKTSEDGDKSGKVNISQIGDMQTLKETSLDQCSGPRDF